MVTKEYLEGFLNGIKRIVPGDMYNKVHNYARAFAGNKNEAKDRDQQMNISKELEKELEIKDEAILMALAALDIVVENEETEKPIKPVKRPEEKEKEEEDDDDEKIEFEAKIVKADNDRQVVYGVVLEPMTDVTPDGDTHGHVMKAQEIEETAHLWLKRYRNVDLQHDFKKQKSIMPVESYLAPMDFTGEDGMTIKKGSWILAVHVEDKEIWKEIKAGKYNMYSPGGFGRLRDI